MNIQERVFGTHNNTKVKEFTLTNSNNVSVSLITYGAIITKILMPDKNGEIENITANFKTLEEMVENRPFHGAIIGRVSGRIQNGVYEDENNKFQLDQNEGLNNLHGGFTGLDTKIWEAQTFEDEQQASVVLKAISPDGEAGFPGNLTVTVTYTLTEQNDFSIQYQAETDKRTLFNPTNHVYFNLNGTLNETIHNHEIQVDSDHFAVLADDNIPTGELKAVNGTPFDLRELTHLEDVLISSEKQIVDRNGLDHPFVLSKTKNRPDAFVRELKSGRSITMSTDLPAVVIYTHNSDHEPVTDGESTLIAHCGLTLETCLLPDAVNQTDFGDVFINPEEPFESVTTFTFAIL